MRYRTVGRLAAVLYMAHKGLFCFDTPMQILLYISLMYISNKSYVHIHTVVINPYTVQYSSCNHNIDLICSVAAMMQAGLFEALVVFSINRNN